MDWTTNVAVHESAGPGFTRERILAALRRGEVDASLLYAGLRQTTLWMALHHAVSPAQRDASVAALYDEAFADAARTVRGNVAHVISLACGDGSKDVRCLHALRSQDRAVLYTPADISLEMVLESARGATASIPGLQANPLVCDLLHCSVLPGILKSFDPSGAERLILFLGAIQNHSALESLKGILNAVRSQDRLLAGSNLAPARDYDAAMARILPQYDNPPTRAWLWGALSELGLHPKDGELRIEIAGGDEGGLKRFEACFIFGQTTEVAVLSEKIAFEKGASLRVFYSQRFTPNSLREILRQAGLEVVGEWTAPEEGLFLCRRAPQ